MRQTIIGYLNRRLNCEFIEAQSGEEALGKIKKDKPNLVLLDIKMRGISGLEVIKQIAQIDKDIPILVITAWDSEEIATQVVKEGAVDYVPKPFSAQVLLMKIKGLLKYKQKLTSG
jgi:DNA-binding response OmpR family regulator